ncbi:hypothetical protein [Actinomadura sp. NTSP31]|uniref:hypothetical protein n=1 Tax=Actinomadura sp. NTSP31 TaxID=1735447 RepID=UPI0035BEE5E6
MSGVLVLPGRDGANAAAPTAPTVPGRRGPVAGADAALSAGAADRIERVLSDRTRAAYARQWESFARWCWLTGRTAMPASAQTLASYIDHLSRTPTGRGTPPAPGTLAKALGCLQGLHKAAGHVADVRLARAVLTDYRRERAHAGHRPRRSTPVTARGVLPLLLEATLDAVTTPRLDQRISALRALQVQVTLVLGLTLAGRSSEIAALDIEDIAFPEPGRMTVTIRASKTDQQAAGSIQHIQRGQHVASCPVRLTQAWIDTLAAHGITDGPLIRAVDQYDRLAGTPGYAARHPAGGVPRIGNTTLNALVRAAVARVNDAAAARGRPAPLEDPSAYSWHGLRAGLATSGGEANIPPTAIGERGRWKSLLMVMRYWRDGAAWRRQLEAEIGL